MGLCIKASSTRACTIEALPLELCIKALRILACNIGVLPLGRVSKPWVVGHARGLALMTMLGYHYEGFDLKTCNETPSIQAHTIGDLVLCTYLKAQALVYTYGTLPLRVSKP